MSSQSGIFVYCVIFDLACDPNEVTRVLGIEPDEIERVGDLTRTGRPKLYPSNCWRLNSKLEKEFRLESHINHLMDRIGNIAQLSTVSNSWGVRFQCVIDFRKDDNSPSLHLSQETINKLSNWNSSVDVDYYLWGEIENDNYGNLKG